MSISQATPGESSVAFPVIGVTGLPCSGKSFAANLLAEGKVPGIAPGRLFKADDAGHTVLERPDVKALLRAHFGAQIAQSGQRGLGVNSKNALQPAQKNQPYQPYQADQKGWTDQSGRYIYPQREEAQQPAGKQPDEFPEDPVEFRKAIAGLVFSNPENLAWLEGVVHPLVVSETDDILCKERGKRPVVIESALLFAADMDVRCDRIVLVEADFAVRLNRAAKRGWSREELQRREKRQIPLFTAAWERDSSAKIRVVANNGNVDELIRTLTVAITS